MRRILLLLVAGAVLTLPAAASARPQSHRPAPGFLVVRNAATDGGITGHRVATVAVQGFVLGHIAQEGAVEIYHFNSGSSSVAQVSGGVVSRHTVTYHGQQGVKFSGSDFGFRGVGGVWRVVVYGAGISLYAGGKGVAHLHGSASYPNSDGVYSFNGAPSVSLPAGVVKGRLGQK
jgi:hypothetical protein